MHDIRLLNSKDKCISANKDEEEKNALIRVRLMIMKSFVFLNTMLSKIKRHESSTRAST